jgi:hypothetical protein
LAQSVVRVPFEVVKQRLQVRLAYIALSALHFLELVQAGVDTSVSSAVSTIMKKQVYGL